MARDLNRGQLPTRALVRLALMTALPPQARATVGIMRTLLNISRTR
jgi:hypothetical protein